MFYQLISVSVRDVLDTTDHTTVAALFPISLEDEAHFPISGLKEHSLQCKFCQHRMDFVKYCDKRL